MYLRDKCVCEVFPDHWEPGFALFDFSWILINFRMMERVYVFGLLFLYLVGESGEDSVDRDELISWIFLGEVNPGIMREKYFQKRLLGFPFFFSF